MIWRGLDPEAGLLSMAMLVWSLPSCLKLGLAFCSSSLVTLVAADHATADDSEKGIVTVDQVARLVAVVLMANVSLRLGYQMLTEACLAT